MKKDNITKYLQNYAEKDIGFDTGQSWDNILIIPAVNEFDELLETLASIRQAVKDTRLLLVLVVNATVDAAENIITTNLRLIRYLKGTGTVEKEQQNKTLIKYENYHILLLDHTSGQFLFSSKAGVGLARKIGGDAALNLIKQGNIKSGWLRYTDADVKVPPDFFSFNPDENKFSAIIYPFYHENIYNENFSALMYEIYLRYYVLGLKYAGSMYAYHTIGSTISVSAEGYAMVRGFPKKREAAEDFYMLNKLAKTAPFYYPDTIPLIIKGRVSDRVPFGTGNSLIKINELLRNSKEYCIYDPDVFQVLKDLLQYFLIIAETRNTTIPFVTFEPEIAESVAINLDLKNALDNILTLSKDMVSIQKHINNWFDAFRTLKLINYLSSTVIFPVPWYEAIKKAGFIPEIAGENIIETRDFLFNYEKVIFYPDIIE